MQRNNKLLLVLSLLVIADYVLTWIAVGHLGMTEPNPLFYLCGGFDTFIVVKVLLSTFCLAAMFVLMGSAPKIASVLITILCIMYGVAVFGGAALIVWSVI